MTCMLWRVYANCSGSEGGVEHEGHDYLRYRWLGGGHDLYVVRR